MQKYYLGVDGGNTKTDYLLCTAEGEYVDVYRTGSCSHERFDEGYGAMERVMREQLSHILERNNIGISDITAAGFGLAGADLPVQIAELKKRVEAIGFSCYGLSNDGILGVKAASRNGVGLCAVNGTGTVVVGIDEKGDILQIGGVGPLSGDFAGGGYIRNQVISLLYAYHCRCGKDSSMFAPIMEMLGADPDDMLTLVSDHELLGRHSIDIIQTAAKAAIDGDALARGIFDAVGASVGQTAAGCIRRLSFEGFGTPDNPIDVVQVGSIWYRVAYDGMNKSFLQTVQALSGKSCRTVRLDAPAAVGGVLWAKEVADGKPAEAAYREKVLASAAAAFND